MDRVTFLARLREHLKARELEPSAAVRPAPAADAERVATQPGTLSTDGLAGLPAGLVELFAARLRASGGEVSLVGSEAEAWSALVRLAAERGWSTVACAAGVAPPSAGAALHIIEEAAEADFGLSEADWAIAETGSVVVKASQDVRRGYSLLPAAVGFLVAESRLRATMGDVLRGLPAEAESMPSCVSVISGPSGTSDLAAVHVVGVHGPGEVFVWVIEDARPPG